MLFLSCAFDDRHLPAKKLATNEVNRTWREELQSFVISNSTLNSTYLPRPLLYVCSVSTGVFFTVLGASQRKSSSALANMVNLVTLRSAMQNTFRGRFATLLNLQHSFLRPLSVLYLLYTFFFSIGITLERFFVNPTLCWPCDAVVATLQYHRWRNVLAQWARFRSAHTGV